MPHDEDRLHSLGATTELYRGTRVMVLGASGFIGRWTARALYERGAKVRLVARNRATVYDIFSKTMVQADVIEADLRDTEAVSMVFRDFTPSITFNLAGYGIEHSERDETTASQINAQLVKTICEAITKDRDREWPGQDIIHVGSVAEYGPIGGNLSEGSSERPTTMYGKSKLAGTRWLTHYCQEFHIKGLTSRLFTIYGPGEHGDRLLPSLIETARSGKPLSLSAGIQKKDFTYVHDIVEGILRLGLVNSARPGEIVNLATGTMTSVRRFAETAGRILGIPAANLNFGAIPNGQWDVEHSEISLERLKRLTGWVPSTSIDQGIRQTLEAEIHCTRG
jgi:UDP-glucose 4-epimerase